VARWPALARLETGVKLLALGMGLLALGQALETGVFGLPAGLRLVQFVILVVLSLGLVAAIFDRLAEREIVAMVFVLLNNLGHWGMVVALASEPGPGGLLVGFGLLMLAGDLIKLVFLKVHRFSVRDTPPVVLYGLTLFYVVGYLANLLLELLR
jgi:hypothetical protein